jgi:hypothetical protein
MLGILSACLRRASGCKCTGYAQKQIYGQPGGCNVVGFETREACANLSGVMMGRLVPAPR